MAKNIVVLTAKGGNTTLQNKNVMKIGGRPSMCWSIQAAKESKLVDEIFVSTESDMIREIAIAEGVRIIDRPTDLAQAFSNHGDVILHAAKAAQSVLDDEIATVTILLGNTVMTVGADIDDAIAKTLSAPEIDSAMTVWKAQDDHPMRAMVIGPDGYLKPFLDGAKPDTNRQSYKDVFFYDQGPWTVRMSSLLRSETTREGPGAWWWMGKNSVAIERLWVTGRDTHSQYDVDIAEWWLNHYRNAGVRNPSSIDDYKKS